MSCREGADSKSQVFRNIKCIYSHCRPVVKNQSIIYLVRVWYKLIIENKIWHLTASGILCFLHLFYAALIVVCNEFLIFYVLMPGENICVCTYSLPS